MKAKPSVTEAGGVNQPCPWGQAARGESRETPLSMPYTSPVQLQDIVEAGPRAEDLVKQGVGRQHPPWGRRRDGD